MIVYMLSFLFLFFSFFEFHWQGKLSRVYFRPKLFGEKKIYSIECPKYLLMINKIYRNSALGTELYNNTSFINTAFLDTRNLSRFKPHLTVPFFRTYPWMVKHRNKQIQLIFHVLFSVKNEGESLERISLMELYLSNNMELLCLTTLDKGSGLICVEVTYVYYLVNQYKFTNI